MNYYGVSLIATFFHLGRLMAPMSITPSEELDQNIITAEKAVFVLGDYVRFFQHCNAMRHLLKCAISSVQSESLTVVVPFQVEVN